ncbi:MAG TPA: DMT family transporter [Patescibacteria group bacterium]|nr:DMT family transporter [Patescibacteria group bacterium]
MSDISRRAETKQPFRPILWCLAAAALFGASAPAARVLLRDTGPVTLAGLLYLGAAAGVLPLTGIFSRQTAPRLRGNRSSLVRLALAIVCGGAIAPVLMLEGLRRAPAASVAMWLSLEAVTTVLLAWLFFHEHVHGRAWIAAGMICGASLLLVAPAGPGGGPVAAALVALACLFWGLDNNFTAMIDGFTPAQCTFAKGLLAGSVNVAIGLRLETAPLHGRAIASALMLGAASYGLSLVLYISGAQQLGAARAQMVFATSTFWGVVLCWTLFSEPVSMGQIVAGPILAVALWLLHTERHEHPHAHQSISHVHWHRHDDEHHRHEHPGNPNPRLSPWFGHSHEHSHEPVTHAHAHRPDLHHRHLH